MAKAAVGSKTLVLLLLLPRCLLLLPLSVCALCLVLVSSSEHKAQGVLL